MNIFWMRSVGLRSVDLRSVGLSLMGQMAVDQMMRSAAIALISGLLGSLSLTSAAIAQPSNTSHPAIAQLPTSVQFVPPPVPDRGRPRGRRSGTASRGACLITQLPLTALVPVTQINPSATDPSAINIAYESAFSLTTQPNPTFWFYTPYPLSETPIEFTLQDEQDQTLYERRWKPIAAAESGDEESGSEENGGILKVQIPETALTLTVGTPYRWYLTAYCGEYTSDFVEGWIERVSAEALSDEDLAGEDFAAASPIEKAQMYAQKGIWQDALTQLGMRSPNDAELEAAWIELLSSVGLEEIAQQPLIDCCE